MNKILLLAEPVIKPALPLKWLVKVLMFVMAISGYSDAVAVLEDKNENKS